MRLTALFDGDDLERFANQASRLAFNDYEAKLMEERTGKSPERLAREVLVLPTGPTLSLEDVDTVSGIVSLAHELATRVRARLAAAPPPMRGPDADVVTPAQTFPRRAAAAPGRRRARARDERRRRATMQR